MADADSRDLGPADLDPGQTRLVRWGERELLVGKIDGGFFAIDNACPHAGAPLSEGELEGTRITCPFHGWAFDVISGKCVNVRAADAETFNVEARDGRLYLAD
jgi:nitrite reductase/ring-hydroxylating ferredoxin subunit